MIAVNSDTEIQNQVVSVVVSLPGSPFHLRYRSDRAPGYGPEDAITVQVTGQDIPDDLLRIDLELSRNGETTTKTFPAEPGQTYTVPREGDASAVMIELGYVYAGEFPSEADRHAYERNLATTGTEFSPTVTTNPEENQITIWRKERGQFAGDRWTLPGLDGWTLDGHHRYDPTSGTVYLGEGNRRTVDPDTVRVERPEEATLPDTAEETYRVPAVDGSLLYVFDSAGRHRRTTDPMTGVTLLRFQYANNRLVTVEDAYGNTTDFEYDADGSLTRTIRTNGEEIEFDTIERHIERITDTWGDTVQFDYDDAGLVTTLTDTGGRTTRFTYDDEGRVTSEVNPRGNKTNYVRTDTENATETRLITPELREYTYRVEDSDGGGERRINTCCGGLEVKSERTDDSYELTYPDGTSGRIAKTQDPRFEAAVSIPDTLSIETGDGISHETEFEWDLQTAADGTLEELSAVLEQDGQRRTTSYSASERATTDVSPEGRTRHAAFNEYGRITEIGVPGLHPVTFAYDERGQLVASDQGPANADRRVTLEYDEKDRLTKITDPYERSTEFGYRSSGRISHQSLPGGRRIGYDYNEQGDLASITVPGGATHRFEYSAGGLLSVYVPPGDGADRTVEYEYTADDQLRAIVEPTGRKLEFEYDEFGRVDATTMARGNIEYDYHPDTGNFTRITSPDDVVLSFEYTGSFPTRLEWTGPISGTVQFSYGADGSVASYTVDDTTIEMTYDADGLPVQAGDLRLTHHPEHGLLTGTTIGDLVGRIEYNQYGEPINRAISCTGTDESLYEVDRQFDELGRIVEERETINGETKTFEYAYDAAGRLAEVSDAGRTVATYEYDPNGNCVRRGGPDESVTAHYDEADRLQSWGETQYDFTADGDLHAKMDAAGTTTYDYDTLGNLTTVQLPDGTEIEYVIDGQNRRVGKRVDGEVVNGFLYRDAINPIAEVDGDGNVVSLFVYATAGTVPDYLVRADGTYRIISDYRGSPRLVVDVETGDIAQRMAYDAFGDVVQDTNPGFQPFGFAGGIYDSDTGFVRFGARDYDPKTGRWTTTDPIGFAGGSSNFYEYAGNDPVNRTDPLGLAVPLALAVPLVAFLAGGAIGGVQASGKFDRTFFTAFLSSGARAALQATAFMRVYGALSAAHRVIQLVKASQISSMVGVVWDLLTTRSLSIKDTIVEFFLNFIPGGGTILGKLLRSKILDDYLEEILDTFTGQVLDPILDGIRHLLTDSVSQPDIAC